LLVAPLVLRAPSGPAAREARASLRSAPRLEARPGPPDPPAPSTLAVLIVCVLPARPRHHPLAPCPGRLDSPAPSTPVAPGCWCVARCVGSLSGHALGCCMWP